MNPAARLQFELTEAERELMVRFLEGRLTELSHEIHRTSKLAMRQELEQRQYMLEQLLIKFQRA
jgi:hypothetical protein